MRWPRTLAVEARDSPTRFVLGVMSVYVVLVLVGIARHEMWRDELHAWVLAAHSASFTELSANKAYEGHPSLWYVALFLISRVTTRPLFMQVFHALVAITSVLLVLRYCPLPRHQRVLLAFGYYLLYEYAVISRMYALGVLLIAIFCALRRTPQAHPVAQVLVLALLMQTSMFGLLVALALLIVPAADIVRDAGRTPRIARAALPAAVALAGLVVSVFDMAPPPDTGVVQGWHLDLSPRAVGMTLTAIWKGFAPLPAPSLHFWNSNLVASNHLQLALSVVILVTTVLMLRPWPLLLAVYVVGLSSMLAFLHTKYFGYTRHHGHLFLLFIVCWWLASYEQSAKPVRAAGRPGWSMRVTPKHASHLVTALLAVHCLAGVHATIMDWAHPFSASRTAARFLEAAGLRDARLTGYLDPAAAAVAGHLDRAVYYLAAERDGTFVIFDTRTSRQDKPLSELVASARRLAVDPGVETVLILNRKFPAVEEYPITPVGEFTESIEPSERFYVYLLKR